MKILLASASVIATLIFCAAVVVLLFLAPDIDPMRSGISFYAYTRYALLIGIALTLVGVSGILLAVALWPAAVSFAGRTGLILLTVWGITSILAGVFPLDPPNTAPTLSGSIHNMAGLNFMLVAPALFLIELRRSTPDEQIRSRPLTYWLAWLVLFFAILLFVFNGPLSPIGIGGLIQRLYWLAITFWLLFKAQDILRTDRKPSAA